jgi:hypothetical protein
MEVQVTALNRRGSALMRQSWRVSARRVRFGRGTGSEILLSDIRVDLVAAALYPLGDGIVIEALGPTSVRVNGVSARTAPVKPGDEIEIGPYLVRLEQPPDGLDAALIVELVQPLGDSLGRLLSRSRIGLERTGISKRRAAWIGVLLILLSGLVAPIAVFTTGSIKQSLGHATAELTPMTLISLLWNPGEMSNSHRFFAGDCATCHERPFARVADRACLGCHEKIGSHIDPSLPLGGMQHTLEAERCADCHQEHRGTRGMVVNDMRLCGGCHRSLAETTPAAGVSDVVGFPAGHPQFRATIVADSVGPKLERVSVAGPPPLDRPGIKFSHAAHLVAGGFPALGIKPMECAGCHVAEPSGQGFQPITYKQQCAGCHGLDFERQELPWPNARVPHGDDTGIAAAVWNFYAGKALQGGIVEPLAPAVTRRVPGAPLSGTAGGTEGDVQRWVSEKAEAALRTIVLDEKRGCAYCHFGAGPNGAVELSDVMRAAAASPGVAPGRIVAPVVLRARFLPHARFDHAKHAATACEACHPARQAEALGQLLIPGIENCAECHGSERASLRAQSTCTTCHRFHFDAFGPMRGTAAASQQ